jgi:AraC-like DNA-binding protein
MKHGIAKSAIPESKSFVIRKLVAPFFDRSYHFHPEYQLFVVIQGTGNRFVGDTIKSFSPGDMVLTGPYLPHVWRSDKLYLEEGNLLPTEGLVIYFNEDFLGDTMLKKDEMAGIAHLLQRSCRGLEITGETAQEVAGMMEALLHLKGAKCIIQLIDILDTLAGSADCHPIAHTGFQVISKQAETDRMSIVYEYVIEHFAEKVQIAEVASLCNMTPTSFSRYFKSRVNKSFSDFLQDIRIDHACKMLQREKMSIAQVAYECGYQTLSNFNQQFRKITGQSPLQYKSQYLQVTIDTFGDF